MNGRVYDPTIGRFLSADPFIQAPGNIQSYNRYSYTLNNPLKYTDPSGYIFKRIGKWWKRTWNSAKRNSRAIASVVLTAATAGAYMGFALAAGPITSAAYASAQFAASTLGGFVGGAVGSNSLRGGLVGAFTGGMLHGVGSTMSANSFFSVAGLKKTVAHGLVGGVNSTLMGGKFAHGFASMGFTQGANLHFGDVGLWGSAAIGGAASELVGGSFRRGALQGAMSRTLNDCLHGGDCGPSWGKATNLARANRMRRASFEGDNNVQLSTDGSFQVFGGVIGSSVSAGAVFDSTHQNTCLYTTMCFQIGLGVFIGGGVNGNIAYSDFQLLNGKSEYWGIFGSIGSFGASGGGSLNFGDGSGSAGKAFYGPGKGAAAGLQFCEVSTYCN
jgi:hypothetical protein